MSKNIVYLTNFYLDDVIEQRSCKPFVSQAGQNKCSYMIKLFEQAGHKISIWSNAWTSSKCMKFYKGFQSKLQSNIYYSDILGFPFLNVWFCKRSCKAFLEECYSKKQLDAIVFYNMRLENASVALWAKKKWEIPIILQYEDGLTLDEHVKGLKRLLYRRMEKRILPLLDGAFLVNSQINMDCPTMVVRGAIIEEPINTKNNINPVLLYAGSLDEQRGVQVLLQALGHTASQFELRITGRGALEGLVRSCKDVRVKYLGYLDYESYKDNLAKADICINAQLSNASFAGFSFPSKLSEYISHHKLIISSDVADVKTALRTVAFIYEEDDPQKLAEKIDEAIRVWKDDILFEQYQDNIQKYIEDNSMENMANRLNDFLNEAIGE